MGKRERQSDAGCDDDEMREGGDVERDAPEVPHEAGTGVCVAHRAEGVDPEMLRFYYRRLFPCKDFYRWLTYGKAGGKEVVEEHEAKFPNREFCFTLDAGGGDEIFARYQSFSSPEDMQKSMMEKCPVKIDIGPIYSNACNQRLKFTAEQFKPIQRELVFDIDMTDYDDIRTCCKGAAVCQKCWTFICCAMKILDAGLRADFGFERIMWVFSGRRGVHCWVCDDRARNMSDESRAALAEYFSLYKGSDNNKKNTIMLTYPMHPSLQRAFQHVEPLFLKLVKEQGYLENPEQWERILSLIPEDAADVRDRLRAAWEKEPERKGAYRWNQFKETIKEEARDSHKKGGKRWTGLRQLVQQVIFAHTYPRLDINVSKKMNHLLKAPFCIHPKTGKVCVPICVDECEQFDPAAVPTLSALYNDCLHENSCKDPNAADQRMRREDNTKSTLSEHIKMFRNSVILPFERAARSKLGLASDDLF